MLEEKRFKIEVDILSKNINNYGFYKDFIMSAIKSELDKHSHVLEMNIKEIKGSYKPII